MAGSDLHLSLHAEERCRRQRRRDVRRGILSVTKLEQLADVHWRQGAYQRMPGIGGIDSEARTGSLPPLVSNSTTGKRKHHNLSQPSVKSIHVKPMNLDLFETSGRKIQADDTEFQKLSTN